MSTDPPKAKAKDKAAPLRGGALDSSAGLAWLASELHKAEEELRKGPGGSWQYNESKRPALEERVAFLEALIDAATTKGG